MSVLREGIDREKHGEAPPPVLQGVGSERGSPRRWITCKKWDRQRGHRFECGEGEGDIPRSVVNLVRRYEGCGRVCKNKRRLALHQKRMHRAADERVGFSCERYGMGMETEGAKVNH